MALLLLLQDFIPSRSAAKQVVIYKYKKMP